MGIIFLPPHGSAYRRFLLSPSYSRELSSSSDMVLFCLTFSESSLASSYTLASPWHQVLDFYERLKFCSTLVSTLGEGINGISSWGQWDGLCPTHAHILAGIEHLPHSN
jgi:hypothetical protein